jgi:hypothetical protein
MCVQQSSRDRKREKGQGREREREREVFKSKENIQRFHTVVRPVTVKHHELETWTTVL